MSDVTPSRTAVLELKDERHAMREGYDFLDEKCLLLAGEMLRELGQHEILQRTFLASHARAVAALRAAIARHGLQGLEVYPCAESSDADMQTSAHLLMGVRLQTAEMRMEEATPPAAVNPSPEATSCAHAFFDLVRQAAPLAALSGNLERLYLEYRRATRRARALQDVLLPELDRTLAEVEGRLDELEQEEALGMWHNVGIATSA